MGLQESRKPALHTGSSSHHLRFELKWFFIHVRNVSNCGQKSNLSALGYCFLCITQNYSTPHHNKDTEVLK